MASIPRPLNLVIPMAGRGSRFAEAGYPDPKPFINFLGKTMIEHVVDALPSFGWYDVKPIFIVQKEHDESYNATDFLKARWPTCEVIIVDGVTQGAACTVLLAEHLINNDSILAIMNSDNIIEFDGEAVCKALDPHHYLDPKVDGVILTFEDVNPKWSFAKTDKFGRVLEVAEKKPISTHATAGIYFWRKGSSFVSAAKSMIIKNFRINDEFYVAPVYNENIEGGEHVIIQQVHQMHGVGTPEDLQNYISKR